MTAKTKTTARVKITGAEAQASDLASQQQDPNSAIVGQLLAEQCAKQSEPVVIGPEFNNTTISGMAIGWDLAAGPDSTHLGYVINEQDIEALAQIAHEANRAYCTGLGDDSQVPWAQASEHVRDGAIACVRFLIDNPAASQAAQHDAWAAMKTEAGWVHGEVKDEQAKTHPCLVPYDDLPAAQRAKDQLFQAVVRLAKAAIEQAAQNLLDNFLTPNSPVAVQIQGGVANCAALDDPQPVGTGPAYITGPVTLDQARALPITHAGFAAPFEPLTAAEIRSFKAHDGTTMEVVQFEDGSLAAAPVFHSPDA